MTPDEMLDIVMDACNQEHGTGGWGDYHICTPCIVKVMEQYANQQLERR